MAAMLGSDGLRVGRMRVRSADRDALSARRRLEAQLAGVGASGLGLPPQAFLFVKRLTVKTAPPVHARAGDTAMARALSLTLARLAQHARRPWIDDDASHADVVVFLDEAELIACLARDWRRGLLTDRWWWRSVLLDASPSTWLRREVIPHADALVPALVLLATRGEAAAFVARLEPADCAQAIVAVARTYAVPLNAGRVEPGPSPSAVEHAAESVVGVGAATTKYDIRHEAVRRLLREVPELRRARLDVAQRRLLALALALPRAPTWARTPPMAIALEALSDEQLIEPVPRPKPAVVWASRQPAHTATAQEAEALEEPGSPTPQPHRVSASAIDAPPAVEIEPLPASRNASPETIPHSAAASQRAATHRGAQLHGAGGKPLPIGESAAAAPPPATVDDTAHAVGLPLETPRAQSGKANGPAVEAAPRIETRFGGLFYLLNAALALGLYGDFTTPRSAGIALSPWDWLALVGRAWFGNEVVDDPVWTVLAHLAGREEGEEPGRDFEPPAETWFEDHLVILEARIALGVGIPDADVLRPLVCRHEAGIEITAGTVHVFLSLRDLPLSIRIAGLDRDPGWIPAAGRDVRFVFA